MAFDLAETLIFFGAEGAAVVFDTGVSDVRAASGVGSSGAEAGVGAGAGAEKLRKL